ncbi:Solute carrier family 22 member 5 High-affinity sodium-dependent carnitine cotransporter [Triplophysa tibetana]|uniref:Solute carrier family 22 member 5 High-affinity sodium-dependent carnitine cotransporter n=1 Tax=Triplophysa tibetana TaxID=1572043 RepID=A0A5A9PHV2_9TELE|nr:Solute carrier family 22 member 5 High-affinity sodium-dependent carnitine cotransporter [Triplophysa tibetana]KAA0720546.1 Solute carrier family 22 member 5 High-affinity sodium-dependent carnitine cotransporter [Triplophysa tibetana]
MQDYEETTAFLGTWGPFQKMVFILLCTSTVPNGFSAFSVIFLADIPPHHCRIPDSNLSDAWRNASIPLQQVEGKLERVKCSRYNLDAIQNFSRLGFMPHDVNLTDVLTESCADGWVYSKDIYQSTIVSEAKYLREIRPMSDWSCKQVELVKTSTFFYPLFMV